MKTRILHLELMALLAANLLVVAGCDASRASTTNASATSDPLTFKSAPNVAQSPAETNSAPASEQVVVAEAAKTPPANLQLSPALADVVRLIQADMEPRLVLSFISNSTTPFNIGAEQMNYLNDLGTSGEISLAMIRHDYAMDATAGPSAVIPAEPPAAVTADTSEVAVSDETQAAPAATEPVVVGEPAPVTVNYIYETLSPYGSWVEIDGYGRCWQPTIVLSQPGWRPYCDNGHWVYSNRGWYWASGYSWDMAFHYGRWFNDPRHGWCWLPDTMWSPAWVNWRESQGYCGWAPLPPRTGWITGVGLTFGGNVVSAGFDFGLAPGCYTFVPRSHFRDRRPYRHALPTRQVTQIINQTTVVNNYGGGRNDHIHNNGIAPETVRGNPPRQTSAGSNPGHGGPGRHFDAPSQMPSGQAAPTIRPPMNPVISAPTAPQNHFSTVRQPLPQQIIAPTSHENLNMENHSLPMAGNGATRGNHFNPTPPAHVNQVPVVSGTPMPVVSESSPAPVRMPPIRMSGESSPRKQDRGGNHFDPAPSATTRVMPVAPAAPVVRDVPSIRIQSQSVPVQQPGQSPRDATQEHRNHSDKSDNR